MVQGRTDRAWSPTSSDRWSHERNRSPRRVGLTLPSSGPPGGRLPAGSPRWTLCLCLRPAAGRRRRDARGRAGRCRPRAGRPEVAQECAHISALNALAAAAGVAGGLDAIERIVKVVGFVASDPSFTGQPTRRQRRERALPADLRGRGRHARSAVGSWRCRSMPPWRSSSSPPYGTSPSVRRGTRPSQACRPTVARGGMPFLAASVRFR